MKMAISDGLSESAILEVIDDVTSSNDSKSFTPHKRCQPVKVDLARTPRQRPDQLAVGFNYHSDVVIKESPKTVNGQIIPLESLKPPKERTEQLAVGFSYQAEQLVKDSPKTEAGEVLIPGVITTGTPRRRARDQLAVGFNYHSEIIAKEQSFRCADEHEGATEGDSKNRNVKYTGVDQMNEMNTNCQSLAADCGERICLNTKSGKKLFKDTIAVGFSYNSDQMVKESLSEINGNLADEELVSELIEDASLGEGRNLVEAEMEENSPENLPAGSVW